MHGPLEFLLKHGALVLFAWVFAEQLGFPLPSIPLLLAAGALAGASQLSLPGSLLTVVLAASVADFFWYELGRRRGSLVLHWLCRISLAPDSCVRRAEEVFEQHGARSLFLAKFLPGLSTVAPPLAGVFQMRLLWFLVYDVAGTAFWAGCFLGLGYAFSGEIERVAGRAMSLGSAVFVLLAGALAAYIGWKFLARRRFLRELRIARITPEELKQKLDAGEDMVIVDLRHALDFGALPKMIPGALRMEAQDLQEKNGLLPGDREIILYCT